MITKYITPILIALILSLSLSTAYYKRSYDKSIVRLGVVTEERSEALESLRLAALDLQQCHDKAVKDVAAISALCEETSRVDSVVKDFKTKLTDTINTGTSILHNQKVERSGMVNNKGKEYEIIEKTNVISIDSAILPDDINSLLESTYREIYLHKNP